MGKEWGQRLKDATNVYQRPRLSKEQAKRDEMNNTIEGINTRITEAEQWVNDLEDRMVEITATEQNIGKGMKRNENSLKDPWDNNKCTSFHITEVPA